jgi:hypothetical protein
MEYLQSNETDLIGNWIVEGKNVRRDEVSNRIEWLTTNILGKIAVGKQWALPRS